jgi:hypothetical protein
VWISVQAEAAEEFGHQDQEREHHGLPHMLGA